MSLSTLPLDFQLLFVVSKCVCFLSKKWFSKIKHGNCQQVFSKSDFSNMPLLRIGLLFKTYIFFSNMLFSRNRMFFLCVCILNIFTLGFLFQKRMTDYYHQQNESTCANWRCLQQNITVWFVSVKHRRLPCSFVNMVNKFVFWEPFYSKFDVSTLGFYAFNTDVLFINWVEVTNKSNIGQRPKFRLARRHNK